MDRQSINGDSLSKGQQRHTAIQHALRVADEAVGLRGNFPDPNDRSTAPDWITAFETAMIGEGLAYVGARCECPIEDTGTHLPECGWNYPSD